MTKQQADILQGDISIMIFIVQVTYSTTFSTSKMTLFEYAHII